MARVYAEVNENVPRSYWDNDNSNISWGVLENYEVVRKIGREKYSEVFEGINIANYQKCVVKVLKPVEEKKTKHEIKILQSLAGGPDIIALLDVSQTPSLIFEYVDNTDFRSLYPKFNDIDVRFYILQLLKALEFCHSKALYIATSSRLRLIDWGLAEFYYPRTEYNARVTLGYFKGPEPLFDLQECDYCLDMWSLGAMFASIIFQKDLFFYGSRNADQLVVIAKVLETDDLFSYLNKYEIDPDSQYNNILGRFQKRPWHGSITTENKRFVTNEANDFLDKLLRYDHQERLTAKGAQGHPYFHPVRDLEVSKKNIGNDGIRTTSKPE